MRRMKPIMQNRENEFVMLDIADLACDKHGDIFSGLMQLWDPELKIVQAGEGLGLSILTQAMTRIEGTVHTTVRQWAGRMLAKVDSLPGTAVFLAWNARYTRLRAMCDRKGWIVPADDPRFRMIVTPTACRALEAESIDMLDVGFRNGMIRGSYEFLKNRPLITINRNPVSEADRYRKQCQAAVDATGDLVEHNPHMWQ